MSRRKEKPPPPEVEDWEPFGRPSARDVVVGSACFVLSVVFLTTTVAIVVGLKVLRR